MRLTKRETDILKSVFKKSKRFEVDPILTLDEVAVAIWGKGKRPQTYRETAAWTMRNLSQKMAWVGVSFKTSRGGGPGNVVKYQFTPEALQTAKIMV